MYTCASVKQFIVTITGSIILPDLQDSIAQPSELSLMRGLPTIVATPTVTGLVFFHTVILNRTAGHDCYCILYRTTWSVFVGNLCPLAVYYNFSLGFSRQSRGRGDKVHVIQ